MTSFGARASIAALALLLAAAPGARAQFGPSSSLAPQDGLTLGVPSPLESLPDPRRSLAPVAPGSTTKTVLSLSALYFAASPPIQSGLRWRIFADQADVNGNYPLVLETTDANPFVTLDPGGYIVHVAYGLAAATEHVVIGTESVAEQIALDAGALRFKGMIGNQQIPPAELEFEIHRADGSDDDELIAKVKSGVVLRLKAGLYQVTSTYGQANAKVISEIRVEPGKLTEANVMHKAGRIDLRLVSGRSAIPDAVWSILTPGGDVVSDNLPSPENVILAEGEYVAVARYEGQIFQKPFEVQSGRAARVDVAATN